MNPFLQKLHKIAKHFNSLGTTTRQTHQVLQEGFDLIVLLWGLLHEYFVGYYLFIYLSKTLSLFN